MKKNYIEPAILIEDTQLEQIIAVSLPRTDGEPFDESDVKEDDDMLVNNWSQQW